MSVETYQCPAYGEIGSDDGPSCTCGVPSWTHCPVCRKPIAECLEDRMQGRCSGPHIPDLRHLEWAEHERQQSVIEGSAMMRHQIYLASRFSRLPELLEVEKLLNREGIEVNSRWLRGGHEWVGVPDEAIPPPQAARFAKDDIADISAAHAVMCFTEPARSTNSRGGRHVEFGYALAKQKPVIIVGHRENVFYCLDWAGVAFRESVEEAVSLLVEWRAGCHLGLRRTPMPS